MRGLSPAQKRQIADNFLFWLKDSNIKRWNNTFLLLTEAGEALNCEVYNLWKAHDLLITLGRIERISPNGRKGCRIVSYASLTKPVASDATICSKENCPILKHIAEIFK